MHLVVRLVVHFCNKKNEMFLMVVHLVVHFPLKIDVFRYRNCLFISCFIVVLWFSEGENTIKNNRNQHILLFNMLIYNIMNN